MIHTLKGKARSRHIWLDGELLDPQHSQKVINHSPDGFNWGYGGSGPSQLALAIVLKLTGKTKGYQGVKFSFISKLPQGEDFYVTFSDEQV